MEFDPRRLGPWLEGAEEIDMLAGPLHRFVATLITRGAVKDGLHGVWLGHALHPVLTDLPIGFWTSGFVLDLFGGRRAEGAADALTALGVLTALPTAAAGLADWSDLDRPVRRTGTVHAAANVLATVLYLFSCVARLRGDRSRGVALGIAGATAATLGGFLGGHLVFRRGAGVQR